MSSTEQRMAPGGDITAGMCRGGAGTWTPSDTELPFETRLVIVDGAGGVVFAGADGYDYLYPATAGERIPVVTRFIRASGTDRDGNAISTTASGIRIYS